MSGHSHYSNIKRKKNKKDRKRAKKFSKLTRKITNAAREGGGDPEKNADLRSAIEKARNEDMPNENIERAVKRGTGELKGGEIETVTFGAYGPGGVAVLMEGTTDNRNRTLSEIKQVLKQNEGELAETDSVRWLFKKRGVVEIDIEDKNQEQLELKAIEAGAEDINSENNKLKVYTSLDDFEQVKNEFDSVEIESSGLRWIPKEPAKVDQNKEKKVKKLVKELENNVEIEKVYTNLKSIT